MAARVVTIGPVSADGFSLEQIKLLFAELDAELRRTNDAADLYVVGGAGVAFQVDGARMTEDVDAAMAPYTSGGGIGSASTGPLRNAIRKVAQDNGLDDGWLDDSAGGYTPRGPDDNYLTVYTSPNLRVRVAGLEVLLAMKVFAARDKDVEDLQLLAARLQLSAAAVVLASAARVMGTAVPDDKAAWVRDVMSSTLEPPTMMWRPGDAPGLPPRIDPPGLSL